MSLLRKTYRTSSDYIKIVSDHVLFLLENIYFTAYKMNVKTPAMKGQQTVSILLSWHYLGVFSLGLILLL